MSELGNGVPSGGEGTVAISDDGDNTVLPPQVGAWFIEGEPGFMVFECDACGWQRWTPDDAPLSSFSDDRLPCCQGCGCSWTHLQGIIGEDGQTRTVTAEEVEQLTA